MIRTRVPPLTSCLALAPGPAAQSPFLEPARIARPTAPSSGTRSQQQQIQPDAGTIVLLQPTWLIMESARQTVSIVAPGHGATKFLTRDAEIARLSLGHDAEPAPPPPPDIESPGIVAVDITGKFSEAVKSKGPGQRANHPALRVLADPWRSPISGRAGQRWLLHAL